MSLDLPSELDFLVDYRQDSDPDTFRRRLLDASEQRQAASETDRCIGEYARTLGYVSDAELVAALRGKLVLDVGAGQGRFAQECAELAQPPRVVSVNPRYASPDSIRWSLQLVYSDDFEEISCSHFIRRAGDSEQVAAFAHQLPFRPGSFDLVFDNFASLYYSQQPAEFAENLLEMLRVLRPGGELRAGLGLRPGFVLPRVKHAERILQPFADEFVLNSFGRPGRAAAAGFVVRRTLS